MSQFNWIQTYTGRRVDPLNLKPSDVCIEDIAHALSMMCRYTGHSKYFYSVAEHSVLVSRRCCKPHRLVGLLHDAPEAYLADIASPTKKRWSWFNDAEAGVWNAIADALGIPSEQIGLPCVHEQDHAILADECEMLFDTDPREWGLYPNKNPFPLNCYDPIHAERMFLSEYTELRGSN